MYFLQPQGQAETKYPEGFFGGRKKGWLAARIRIIYSGGTKWRWGHVRNRYQNTTWSHPPKKTRDKALKDLPLSHFHRQHHCGGQTNRRKERFWHCIASALLFYFLLCLTMRISLQHCLSCFRKFLHLIHCTKISIFRKLLPADVSSFVFLPLGSGTFCVGKDEGFIFSFLAFSPAMIPSVRQKGAQTVMNEGKE